MLQFFRVLFVVALGGVSSPAALGFDSREYIDQAVELIEAGQHSLARTYLEPALIDFRLGPGERSRAYYLRGYSFYAQGLYVSASQDYNRALEFNPSNPIVLSAVGQMHMEGRGVDPDPALGVALFEKAVQADHAPAKLRLGVAYLRGHGVEENPDEARRLLTEAADAGLAQAMLYLAQLYRTQAQPDPALARSWYEKAAAAGAEDALAYLGFMAESGEGSSPDPEAALDYFRQAAEAGSAVAQAKMGHVYLTGSGVDSDPARARGLFEQAAAQGHPTGFMGLAYLYETGTAVTQDPEVALDWYRRAAEAGMLDAQLRLAYTELRRGDLPGQQQARAWLARAAAQNSVQALNDYAWLLATSSFDSVRNGQQALTLALQAVRRSRTPTYLDTLAAAYAETGKFDQAVAIQQEALALAKGDDAELLAELTSHLKSFEAGKPWRE